MFVCGLCHNEYTCVHKMTDPSEVFCPRHHSDLLIVYFGMMSIWVVPCISFISLLNSRAILLVSVKTRSCCGKQNHSLHGLRKGFSTFRRFVISKTVFYLVCGHR